MRTDVLKSLHQWHIGIESTLRRARECYFWPQMSADIKEFIRRCPICNTIQTEQPKEPMIPSEIPSRPWEKVATDLFQLSGKNYLITVDYYSNYFEVDTLESTTSNQVIRCLMKHFARHGIPDEVVSDNEPQYIK